MVKALIFGSHGFIGTHLVSLLRQQGMNFALAEEEGVTDIRDSVSVERLLATCRPEVVVNLAGISAVTEDKLQSLFEVNAWAVQRLLQISAGAGVRRFIQASTANLYGHQMRQAVREDAELQPLNQYGVSKLVAEQYCRWSLQEGLEVAWTRAFNCIGRAQAAHFLLPKLVMAFQNREACITLGNIEISRDFVDVRDAAEIYLRLITAQSASGPFNIASGISTSISDVIEILRTLTGHQMDVVSDSGLVRRRDLVYQQGSPARVQSELAYVNKFKLEQTLQWMLEEP